MDDPDFEKLMRVAAEAAGVSFASFCWCFCGQPLAGVVVAVGDGPHSDASCTDVIALACLRGHRVIRICNGVLVEARNIPEKPRR
jgi:hypothetical protein